MWSNKCVKMPYKSWLFSSFSSSIQRSSWSCCVSLQGWWMRVSSRSDLCASLCSTVFTLWAPHASTGNLSNTNLVNMRSKTGGKETPTYIWCKVLEFIRRLIPTLDYKSCRDIFKMLLELAKRIPHSNSSVPPPLENEILCGSKSSVKHKLDTLEDEHFGQDLASNRILLQNSSRVTDNIKLESLFEVNSNSN